jgi:arginine N-succinyltransferase
MRMLEKEGFRFDNYIDIFVGGPTMTAETDAVRTIREARDATILTTDHDGGEPSLVATGRLGDFRCAYGKVRALDGDRVVLDPACAKALGVGEGGAISYTGRA